MNEKRDIESEPPSLAARAHGGLMNNERIDVLAATDAQLTREHDRLLAINTDNRTYREKRRVADRFMRVKREMERRAALASGSRK